MPLPKFRDPFTHKPDPISLEKWLLSDEPADRVLADEALSQMGAEGTLRAYQSILDREVGLRRRGGRVVGGAFVVGWLAFAAGFDIATGAHVSAGAGGAICGALPMFLTGLGPSEMMYRVWERMAKLSDVRVLPALVDAWNPVDKRAAEIVRPALLRLLPRLTADDRHLLNDGQWAKVVALTTVRTKAKHAERRAAEMEMARASLHAVGKAHPPFARQNLLSLSYVEDGTPADERALAALAGNYLAAWEAPSAIASQAASAELQPVAVGAAVGPAVVEQRDWRAEAAAAKERHEQRQRLRAGSGAGGETVQ